MKLNFNDNDFMIFRLGINEKVPVNIFSDYLYNFDQLYFAHLWLNHASINKSGIIFPDTYDYGSDKQELLVIHKLEIGTPNIIELLGKAEPFLPVVSYVLHLLEIPSLICKVVKLPLEIKKLRLEHEKSKLEIEELKKEAENSNQSIKIDSRQISIKEKAAELSSKNKISDVAFAHKLNMQINIKNGFINYFPSFSSDPSVTIFKYEIPKA